MTLNDHWVYQGRQSHGWFGNGTAAKDGGSNAPAEANGLFRAANASQHADFAAHGIVMHVPWSERSLWTRVAGSRDR